MKILLFVFFITLNICATIRTPLLRRKTNKTSRARLAQKPKNRKLFLDWFDSEDESKKNTDTTQSMKKVMELMKLADSFKKDPNFDVNVEISYRNAENYNS